MYSPMPIFAQIAPLESVDVLDLSSSEVSSSLLCDATSAAASHQLHAAEKKPESAPTPSSTGTSDSPLPYQEQQAPALSLAFAVLCDRRMADAERCVALCARLWQPHHYLAVHLDTAASSKVMEYLRANLPPRTTLISTRRTKRDSYAVALASLDLFKAALASGVPWLYVQLLGSDCYPAMHVDELAERYRASHPRLLLCGDYAAPSVAPSSAVYGRVPDEWEGDRHNINVFWGTQWVALTREAADYVVTDRDAMQVEALFASVQCPAECMVHTVLARRWPHFCGFSSFANADEMGRCRIAVPEGRGAWWRLGLADARMDADEAREAVSAGARPMFCQGVRAERVRQEIDLVLYPLADEAQQPLPAASQ
eukprot:m51a1_g6103 hypothetical protein (369) ;mRNA; r:78201-79599